MGDWDYSGNGSGVLSSLNAAVEWVTRVLIGSIGASIAILAVAGIGLTLLSGRVAVRRGIGSIMGCFILFASATIAAALVEASQGAREVATVDPTPFSVAQLPPPLPNPAASYDPYAGASVPTRIVGENDLFQ